MSQKIPLLLVEDEPHIAQGLIFNLEEEGYAVHHVDNGEEALAILTTGSFALMILDLMLPGIDGLEVCRVLRARGNQIPVLMLTARSSEQDRIDGLSEGADDYLAKPFNLKEFLLRVSALLRRSPWKPKETNQASYQFGTNLINWQSHQASTALGTFELTDLEIKMLQLFFHNEGKVLSRGEILEQVWGVSPQTETRTLDNFIVRLRKYFEENPAHPQFFLTVRGRGYRFVNKTENL